jgi:hypothetical protein
MYAYQVAKTDYQVQHVCFGVLNVLLCHFALTQDFLYSMFAIKRIYYKNRGLNT